MKQIFMLVLVGLLNSQIRCAADALSEGEVVNTVLRENPVAKAARAKWETMKNRTSFSRNQTARVARESPPISSAKFPTSNPRLMS